MYSSKAVANYFLDQATAAQVDLTPMKLQKLVYLAHGWSLGLFSKPLIADPIQAVPFGVLVLDLYREFKVFRTGFIKGRARNIDLLRFEVTEPTIPEIDRDTRALLDKVWETYHFYSNAQLTAQICFKDSPWARARIGQTTDTWDVVLRDEALQEHYRAQGAARG